MLTELAAAGVGGVRADAPLADFSTLRVGGPAWVLVTAEKDADLAAVGEVTRRYGLTRAVVGRGSNLLVDDAGFAGLVITLGRGYRGVAIEGGVVRVGAAEPLPRLAAVVADAALGGLAWACGVPGTVGGGVRMNAGAHGGEMADHLVEAEVFRLDTGVAETWPASALGLAYRRSVLPDDAVITSATLRLPPADRDEERARIAEIRRWRREHQPLNEPNCGSVFTNPPGASAGALIEEAGLKGLRVGGARVSELHANFIVTTATATAEDVAALIERVRETVREVHGVELRGEVTRLGGAAGPS